MRCATKEGKKHKKVRQEQSIRTETCDGVRRAIGALAIINILLLAGGYVFSFNDLWNYNDSFLVLQQLVLNIFLVAAAAYSLSHKRQKRLSSTSSAHDRAKEWTRARRILLTFILAALTLFYASVTFSRITSYPNQQDPHQNYGSGLQGCDAYGPLKQACVAQFFISSAELLCFVLLLVEGVFTFREHRLRQMEEEEEARRLEEMPPIVVQYTADVSLPARARTRGEVGMEDVDVEEEEVLPKYERHPKPSRGQAVVIVDMMHLGPVEEEEPRHGPGVSGLPTYSTVVEVSEPSEEDTEVPTAVESSGDPLSPSLATVVSPPEEPLTVPGTSTPTEPESSSSFSSAPEPTPTSQSSTSPVSPPGLPSYTP
ncbi:hypothetical protein BGZ52_003384 [Haplosporangium bisporale]|nr:hypothetical protein BGZ52_003384 [Haplosporangium bisporale]